VFEDFKDRVGSTFTLSEQGFSAKALTLEGAILLPVRNGAATMRPSFSLIFIGGGRQVLPQKLYELSHPIMGQVTLFLVPVGKDERGIQYQALFN
jgi:hypothetical protein